MTTVANDEDLFRMIRDGMPGTAMPGWADMLSDQDMWDLIAHLKTFAGLEEEKPGKQLDYGSQVASSPDSIAKGEELFHQGDRCSECHGNLGKGDAIKKLKDDNGCAHLAAQSDQSRGPSAPAMTPRTFSRAYRLVFRAPRCRHSPTRRARRD